MAEPEEDDDTAVPASTQYELIRDNNFEHLKNPELDDERANKKFLARKRARQGRIGDNHAADNAIIEEITCINFMCHAKLHVKLGPLINFVVGQNGSGKSAVLTAIQLCLGGKASATNRGNSLKSLIKGGTDQSLLIVKLKNEGTDAYQPELYGDQIIVERHFSKQGSSGYRLKSSTNRTISTKKGDVDDIIEYYQLQVDNPMNVLTQDAAKSFIQTSTPKQKYQFFIDGVQLQQLDNDYKMLSDTCDQMEAKLGDAKKTIKLLKKKRDAAQAKHDIVEQHADMRRAVRVMGNQLAWAQVEEVEEELRQREVAVREVQNRIEEAQRIAEEKGETYEVANNALEHAEASVRQLEEELVPVQEEEDIAKHASEKASGVVKTLHVEERDIKGQLNEAMKRVKTSLSDIADEEKRIEDLNGGAHGRKQAEIAEARKGVLDVRQALSLHESGKPRLEEDHRAAEVKLKDIEAPLSKASRDVEQCRRRLDELNSDRGNVMAGFHQKMPQLMQRIRNDEGFLEKPVGPIGLHVKLLKPEWSQMLETVFANTLSGFVVTSKADQVRLSKIIQQFNIGPCPILIGNHHNFSTAGHEPDPQYETILRVLDIDNDLVKRQLIINNRIDQSLLIRKRADGYRVMYEGARPQNVFQCFTTHDSDRRYGHRLGYTGGTNIDMGGVRLWLDQKPRMATEVESQISIQREMLGQLDSEKNELERRKRLLQQALQKCRQALEQHKRATRPLQVAIQKAEDRMEVLEAEFDKVHVEDGRLDAYKDQLAEAQRDQEMYEATYGQHRLEKEKLNEEATTKKREHAAVKVRIAEIERRIAKAQAKVGNARSARQIAVQEKNYAIDAIATLRHEKAKAEEKRDRRKELVDRFVAEASEVCPRVPIDNDETAASLDAKLTALNRQLAAYKKMVGASDQAIYDALREAGEAFESTKTYFEDLMALLLLLKNTFMMRMKMFRRFQKHISAHSRINFNYLLSERAFRGKLSIDHKKKLLDVHVEPDETKTSSKGRATKSLSGGEKSFSSICLLLSLWEAMSAPIRCLDEFDVFMDDVNRDVSSRMIVSLLNPHQYI
jgi:chromosome segregation ATPase